MSWTSEFEPPPRRPGDTEDDPDQTASEPVDGDMQDGDLQDGAADESDDEFWTDRPALTAVPEDGPLDPSIFDGLFDDLTPEAEVDADLTPEAEVDGDSEVLPPEAVELGELGELDGADSAADADVDGIDDRTDEPVDLDDAFDDNEAPITPAPPVEPAPRNAAGDTAPSQEPSEQDAATVDEQGDGFDPQQTPFGVEFDNAEADVEDQQPIDPSSTVVSVNGQDIFEPVEAQHPLQQPQVVITPEAAPVAEIPPANITPTDFTPSKTPTADVEPLSRTTANVQQLQSKPPRQWRSFAVAIAIGAGLGIGGAVLLSQLVGRSDTNDGVASPSTTLQSDADQANNPGTGSQVAIGAESDAGQPGLPADLGATGRFELNALRFEPSTLNLTDASRASLDQVAAATAVYPQSAVSIAVRTYSEPTAAENRDLSKSQAQAITDYLTGAGVNTEAIAAVGLGAPPLSAAQPVENFVVVGAGLQSSALKSAIDGLSPFAIGIDPVTNQLRPESIDVLNYLGQAMAADQATSISLAAYSYGRADAVQNQTQAAVAAEAAAAFLVANHQVDPNRIALLTLGQAQYIVSSDTGNHISIRWGDQGRRPVSISEADQTAIAFAPGSVAINADATQALDRLATAAAQSEASFVIDVHTATENSSSANSQLGERQAAAILDYLQQMGIGDDQLRLYSGGNRRQFGGGPASRVVITPVP
ncbi:MAG: OmpA family protein [Acidimicrobiales bacterium]